MYTPNNCDSCSKQSVCRFSAEYQMDCKVLAEIDKTTVAEITVKCKEYEYDRLALSKKAKEKEDER